MEPRVERLSREDDTYFNSEIKKMERQVIETDYPEMPFAEGRVLPISGELPAGTQFYSYKIRNKIGIAKIIANPGDDYPRVGIDYKEVAGKIQVLGNEYGFTFRDIRVARASGRTLDSDLLFSSREAHMLAFNNLIQYGSVIHNVIGLYNNPNITEYAVSTVGTGSPDTAWLASGVAVKTPDQIIADVNGLIRSVKVLSKGTKKVNTVLLPLEHEAHIASTARSSTSDTTILEFLKRVNPNVNFMSLDELSKERLTEQGILGPDGVSALTGAMMMALTIAQDTVKIHRPMGYTLLPTYQRGSELVKIAEMEIGGTDIRKPFAFAYAKNI